MAKVWDCPEVGGGSDLLALLALADWSDDDGRCWPSMESIARKVRLSEKQARRVVHGLIEAGFVEVEGHHQGGRQGREGRGYSRQYRVVVEKLSTLPPGSISLPPVSINPPTDGRQPVIEPSLEPSVKKLCADGAKGGFAGLPEWIPEELWREFETHREQMGKPFTSVGRKRAFAVLETFRAEGHDPVDVIEQAILSGGAMLCRLSNGAARFIP